MAKQDTAARIAIVRSEYDRRIRILKVGLLDDYVLLDREQSHQCEWMSEE